MKGMHFSSKNAHLLNLLSPMLWENKLECSPCQITANKTEAYPSKATFQAIKSSVGSRPLGLPASIKLGSKALPGTNTLTYLPVESETDNNF